MSFNLSESVLGNLRRGESPPEQDIDIGGTRAIVGVNEARSCHYFGIARCWGCGRYSEREVRKSLVF